MPHQKNIFSFVISILLIVAAISLLTACDSQEGVATVVAERPFSNTYYLPKQLVLWLEEDQPPEGRTAPPWPNTLPAIKVLWQDPLNSEVMVESELVSPLMELFNYRMTGEWFTDDSSTYFVILRPLLSTGY